MITQVQASTIVLSNKNLYDEITFVLFVTPR